MTLNQHRISAIIIIISILGGYVLLYTGHDQSVATLASVILSFYFGQNKRKDDEN